MRDYPTHCELEDTLRRVVREELRETGRRSAECVISDRAVLKA